MRQQRPAVITVFAILNMVFGGLGLLCACGQGIGLLVMVAFFSKLATGQNPEMDHAVRDYTDALDRLRPMLLLFVGLGLVLAVLLLISGFGLLNLKPWGRYACITYAVLAVLMSVVQLVYTVRVANPTMNRVNRQLEEAQAKAARVRGGARAAPPAFSSDSALTDISTFGGAAISIIYAAVLLIVMLLPDVARAFTDQPARRRARRYEDYDEDDYDED